MPLHNLELSDSIVSLQVSYSREGCREGKDRGRGVSLWEEFAGRW